MEVELTPIEGLKIIKPTVYKDDRGYFFESYNAKRFKEHGIMDDFVQDNQSCSSKGVIRGLHFQRPPFAQAKLVRAVRGSVMDVAVDIRRGSPTYGKWFSVILTDENQWQFYLPVGFAHGFVALEENTIFAYKCGAYYNKPSEGSILFDDPDVGVNWNVESPLVSEKDKVGIAFRDFVSPFEY
ncbi:MAG: dTDP-4-dehydrorhamnose 3,5-epimerase [Bacteroidales bacterium]|nr:dTDP-4-dehydrorhamnose 3,5-epimerase [Bacteroidales bacterium]